jgi:hypothetical protein
VVNSISYQNYTLALLRSCDKCRCGINSCQICQTNHDKSVLAALIQSSLLAFLPPSSKLSDQEMLLKMKWVGTSPGEANDSRTTLRVSLETGLAHLHWGVPPAGFSHPVVGRTGRGRHL